MTTFFIRVREKKGKKIKAGFPRFKSKDHYRSITYTQFGFIFPSIFLCLSILIFPIFEKNTCVLSRKLYNAMLEQRRMAYQLNKEYYENLRVSYNTQAIELSELKKEFPEQVELLTTYLDDMAGNPKLSITTKKVENNVSFS